MVRIIALFLLMAYCITTNGQVRQKNLVYVDKHGVIRYTKNKAEASFFGVNYTVPFAYGYRSHKALGANPEKAIDADVYHMARLGLDAFRVHVWDVEISDSLGNLLENEHLRLFDYLIKKLKERNIKILLTPIAFWGNGYPEKDEKTIGFSTVYGKRNAVVLEAAIKAQENYLQQFFKHINPYTKLSYKDDPDVIAMEINNEPQHSGAKEKVTGYVNRLAAAVKSTGWTKPVFYNISESPAYADAVAKASVDGHGFQWYPTALVAGHEQKGNFLPNVDRYTVPFMDTIPQFRNRARMVYEFDAGDVLQSNMYPAMVRSFRTAGFQWATQFAYDPMVTAYGNTEYQTHYLNLAYTPSKAVSLLIASKAFHRLPRLKSYGTFPEDTLFDVFRVSYKNDLSEMNTEEEFYYSNSTSTQPRKKSALQHIAGVGNSAVVDYDGTGAYFLDKLADGIWRLEVMPDAIPISDAFEKVSPRKQVTVIRWQTNRMQVALDDLKNGFDIKGVNDGNNYKTTAIGAGFAISPGVYILTDKRTGHNAASNKVDKQTMNRSEFFAPPSSTTPPFVVHSSIPEVSAGKPFIISAKITGIDSSASIVIELHNTSNQWKTIPLEYAAAYTYQAEVPEDMVSPGVISYRIIVQQEDTAFYAFPGAFKGDPYAWDNFNVAYYESFVPAAKAPLVLFNAARDRNHLMVYNPDWRKNNISYTASDKAGQLMMWTTVGKNVSGQLMGWQVFFGDNVKGRSAELSSFKNIVVKARANSSKPLPLKLSLISEHAQTFSATVAVNDELREYKIPLTALQKDSMLLLPRPYPSFQPLWFRSASSSLFDINNMEKLEVSFMVEPIQEEKATTIEIESVWLTK